jgi:hypothetical protein
MTTSTLRALGKVRVAAKLRYPRDAARDGPLHAEVWRLCRLIWLSRVGPPPPLPGAPASPVTAAPAPASPLVPPVALRRDRPAIEGVCLPPDLRALAQTQPDRTAAIDQCELPCLPRPDRLDADDARSYERRYGITWCRACVPIATPLPVEEILRIERAGNITLCSQAMPRRIEILSSGRILQDTLMGVRAAFGRSGERIATSHDHVAVVIGISRYMLAGGGKPVAERDGAVMAALILERLGYRTEQVIQLANPRRADLDRLLAPGPDNPIQKRLRVTSGTSLLLYVSGRGHVSGPDGGTGFLLPSDTVSGREERDGLAIDQLITALARLEPEGLTVVLEVPMLGRAAGTVVAPNASLLAASPLPPSVRGLVLMMAAERDQHPLEDMQLRLSLFTRHLVEALAGAADRPPIGNGDGLIDSVEAFVTASYRTQLAARKTWGLLQRPVMSRGPALPLVRLPP